jgi:hypothetical protein
VAIAPCDEHNQKFYQRAFLFSSIFRFIERSHCSIQPIIVVPNSDASKVNEDICGPGLYAGPAPSTANQTKQVVGMRPVIG